MALLFSENKKFYITKQGKFAFFLSLMWRSLAWFCREMSRFAPTM